MLLVLLTLSIVSWAIIAYKWRELRRARQDSEAFLEVYHEGSLDAAYAARASSIAARSPAIFLDAYAELARMVALRGQGRARRSSTCRRSRATSAGPARARGCGSSAGSRSSPRPAARRPSSACSAPWSASSTPSTASGARARASLAVVAPGIAEALIATAVGPVRRDPGDDRLQLLRGRAARLTAAIDLFAADYEGDLRRHSGVAPRVGGAEPWARSRPGGAHRPLSEINVTPFVDVMLVLLIIFMVTAPMMQQGIDVDLPETTTQPCACRTSR